MDFNQDKKTNVTKKSLQTYKNFSIKELIEYMGISKKWKKPSENYNKEIIEKLNGYHLFQKFFEKNYLDLFSIYFFFLYKVIFIICVFGFLFLFA